MLADAPVPLLTGCSTGIGRSTAQLLASRGFRVFPTARRLETIVDLSGPSVTPLRLDVDDPGSRRAAVASTLAAAGRIDLLVNNAGYGQMGPILTLPPEKLEAQFRTNVFGLLELTKEVALARGGMVERRSGRIVMVSSIVAFVATPFAAPYCASKFALRAFSDVLRLELRPFGIEVVQVEPGPIRTEFAKNATDQASEVLAERDGPYEFVRPFIEKRLGSSQKNASPAEDVAAIIHAAATSPHPRTRYKVTAQARLLRAAKALLPDAALDFILARTFGLNHRV